MSASRDKDQRVAFLYTNLYKLYQKEKNSQQIDQATVKSSLDKLSMVSFSSEAIKRATQNSTIIKADPSHTGLKPLAAKYHPRNLSNAQPHPIDPNRLPGADRAVLDLRNNLERLQTLQRRIRFMLQEIDEFTESKKKK